jgi:hypothetical protein
MILWEFSCPADEEHLPSVTSGDGAFAVAVRNRGADEMLRIAQRVGERALEVVQARALDEPPQQRSGAPSSPMSASMSTRSRTRPAQSESWKSCAQACSIWSAGHSTRNRVPASGIASAKSAAASYCACPVSGRMV